MNMKNRIRLFSALLGAGVAMVANAAPAPQQPIPDSLDLENALRFGLENNFTIRQARERIKQQEGVEIEVKANQLPQVSASGNYTRNDSDISSYSYYRDSSWSIGLTAKQTIYAGGGVRAAIKSSKLSREAATLELQGVINDQLLLVRNNFYNVLLARESIKVQEENVKLLEEQLKNARNRFEAGAISNFEVLRAEVSLANGRPPLIQARNAYRIAIEQLRQVLGFTTNQGTQITKVPDFVGTLTAPALDAVQLPDALSAARANRPEIQRISKLVDAGDEGVKIAKAGYLPTVQAVAGYNFLRNTTSVDWDHRRDGWTAGLQANWAIFDGRATAGKVAQARSKVSQTRLTLDETTLSIEVEVRRALSSLQEAWELVESTGKVVGQAEEALRLANVRYSAGTATQLDVLTSQVSLTQARQNQLQSYYSYSVARAAFRKAIGVADNFTAN